MAEWSESFISDSQLKQYFLEDVTPTGKVLGKGAFATVVEVKYKQAFCAAKNVHTSLIKPYNLGVADLVKKYKQECQLMTSLRHPNITQFLGLCFLEESKTPAIVMEKLEMSVDNFLEYYPNIPLPLKFSILIDTCSGLVYLHNGPNPIIHRDLTARNVLLTTSLLAKITDLGCSQMNPDDKPTISSELPGTQVYMPPEAFSKRPIYGPSLDVFSFGQLSLYTLIQEFPGQLRPIKDSQSTDDHNQISEVERRITYIEQLERKFESLCPELIDLVKKCLSNDPQGRSSSKELNEWLLNLRDGMKKKYGGSFEKAINKDQVELVLKEMQIQQQKECEDQLKTTTAKMRNDLRVSENEDCSFKGALLQKCLQEESQLKCEYNDLERKRWQLQNKKKMLEDEYARIWGEISLVQEDNLKLEDENDHLQEENTALKARIND